MRNLKPLVSLALLAFLPLAARGQAGTRPVAVSRATLSSRGGGAASPAPVLDRRMPGRRPAAAQKRLSSATAKLATAGQTGAVTLRELSRTARP